MVAATGDGRWMITATTTMRGNARRGEEEVHMTIEDEGEARTMTLRTMTAGETTQQSNGSRERGWVVMVMSKEGCAMGRGGSRIGGDSSSLE
jgi:hypothetical protein